MKISMGVAAGLALMCGLPFASYGSENATAGKADVRAFFQAYLAAANEPVPNVQLPAIWVYSPAGHLVARIDNADDLDAAKAILAAPQAAPLSTMRLTQVTGLLKTLGVDTGAVPEGAWTLLLMRSETCAQPCQPFHAAMESLQASQPGAVRAIDLAFNR
ncbi:hypothetical protein [Stenotrophomonas sp. YAU14D1_LEIMI4_1]|uniref:hypothetical protein n=1 Tax=Stenotrophomonas sp. YAU14D1_LEIMI4_1 TaxID=2072407 RepID=UPI000D5422F5|nr:hypothetical protein [Stenotrophomonas sp. YAU14D1_LEIMI4_1]AWH26376.1 hypothetical protein C1932_15375 [Stenotrophomonas sp. YAU14D1_LEIMI4_1]